MIEGPVSHGLNGVRVHEPFYRGEAAKSAQVEASGLGLSIADHVARGHGGRLVIESEPG